MHRTLIAGCAKVTRTNSQIRSKFVPFGVVRTISNNPLDINRSAYRQKKKSKIQEKLGTEHKCIKSHTPAGSRDYTPEQMVLRQNVLNRIVAVFRKHGAETIDTPVFERKEVLSKYGEEFKLIFGLDNLGGEELALRYDLTVPLARYLASKNMTNIKRYHIGKVYRRDSANFAKGRYREFYQCDFDIAGVYDPMLPDAECVKILSEILNTLDLGQYVIKLNHRQLLDGILEVCGVPAEKSPSICSAIDSLDKFPWSIVRTKMIDEKGLDETTADKIGEYVRLNGGIDLIERLLNDENLSRIPLVISSLASLKLLLEYCNLLGVTNNIIIDLSLARGLDYYTGTIFEAVLKPKTPTADDAHDIESIGSIAGGGRYDNLVGIFDPNGKQVPCVGVSIGIERIFTILEGKQATEGKKIRTNDVDIYVASAHKGLHKKRLEIISKLWDAGICAENSYKLNPKLLNQLQHCERDGVPLAVILGSSELERGEVILRDIPTRKEELVRLDQLTEEIQRRLK